MFDLILVDAKNICYISQHRKQFLDGQGLSVQCTQGFISRLQVLSQAYPAAELVALWDGTENWRKALYPAYKARRDVSLEHKQARSDVERQIPLIKNLCQSAGINAVYNGAAEADDLAAYYSKLALKRKQSILLVSRDGDWLQLINEYVTVYNPVNHSYHTYGDFEKDHGVKKPQQYIDKKALIGDSSDGIAPVGGIGAVKAEKILAEFDSVADFLLVEVKQDWDKAVIEFHDNKVKHEIFSKNRLLMDLLANPEFDHNKNEVSIGKYDEERLFELLIEAGHVDALNRFDDWRYNFKMKMNAELIEELAKAGVGTNDVVAGDACWIDTGFAALNKKISGSYDRGYEQGKMHGIKGGSQTGKTIMASMAMAATQKAGGAVILVDYERAFQLELCEKFGVNTDQPNFFIKRPDTFEDGENYLNTLGRLLRESGLIADQAPILVVCDSLAAAIPLAKLEKVLAGEPLNMKDNLALAAATSNSFPVTTMLAGKYNFTTLYLNQLRESPNMYKPDYAPGGNAWKFYLSTILSLKRENEIEGVGTKKDFIHQDIMVNIEKSRSSKPNQTAKWRLKFDRNDVCYFDTEVSMVMHLMDIGAIKRAGSWFSFGEHKAAGMEKFAELVKKENLMPAMLASLEPDGE